MIKYNFHYHIDYNNADIGRFKKIENGKRKKENA